MENIRDLKRLLLWLAATMVIIHGLGCVVSDGEKEPGTERGPCYPNGTCNANLVCASDLCVKINPLDSAPPDQGAERTDAPLPDLPTADLPPLDGAPDGSMDAPSPDLPLREWAPDGPMEDLPASDLPASDLPVADLPASDQPASDLPVADLPAPDSAPPPDSGGPTSSMWAISAGGILNDRGYNIKVDSSGNSYITGAFQDTVTFGSTTLTSKGGDDDVFVAKMDSGGKFKWAVAAGSLSDDWGKSIVVDGSGNSYVTGVFRSAATFGSTTLFTKGGFDVFVAKVDSGGKFKWVVAAGGTQNDRGYSIALDGMGNSYITGAFEGTATFGSTTLANNNSSYAIFLAKVDSSGKFKWAVSAGGTSYEDDFSKAIALDGMGNSYITGYFSGAATFGSTTLTSKGQHDVFVAKVDSSGNFKWVVAAGGKLADNRGLSIALDGSGNSYLTGKLTGTVTFGSTTLTSQGISDVFVAKVDSGGKFKWAVAAGGTLFDQGESIALDGSGNSYVTGRLGGTAIFGSTTLTYKGGDYDIFVAKVDSGGNFTWAVSAGGTGTDSGLSIALDGSGNSHVTGTFQGSVTFGSTTLTSKGGYEIFVAKLDKNGKF